MADILAVRNIGHEGLGLFEDVIANAHLTVDVIEHNDRNGIPSPLDYGAMLVFGGPASAKDLTPQMQHEKLRVYQAIVSETPFLGICLGHQVLALAQNAGSGVVVDSHVPEIGFTRDNDSLYTVNLTGKGKIDPLFSGITPTFPTFQLHSQEVVGLPGDSDVLAIGDLLPQPGTFVQAMRVGRVAYGIQAHIELTKEMLEKWVNQVPELRAIGKEALLGTFVELQPDYTNTGQTIMRNFLEIAELT